MFDPKEVNEFMKRIEEEEELQKTHLSEEARDLIINHTDLINNLAKVVQHQFEKIVEEYKIIGTYRSDPDYKLVYYVVFEDNTRIEIDGKIQNLIIYSNVQNIQK